ncbi:MAG TPA: tripartite tricarboxylate transporter permease, partial [Xanthobacteraceae bacterium]|nr:tripartite tricarboxylate transporter permease [Xanthobacteraceae bacterium]
PQFIQQHPDVFWGVVASMYIGNLMLLLLNLPLVGLWVKLLKVPYHLLALIVVVICVVGAYSVSNSVFDVGLMVFFGAFGYVLRKCGFPAAPLILALILGPILERSLQQALLTSAGDPTIFIERPISATLLMMALLMMLLPAVTLLRGRRLRPT